MTTLKLRMPIKEGDNELHELTLRAPNGGDIRKCGVPYRLGERSDGSSFTDFDADSVSKYISTLAAVPPSTVDQLTPADWQACMNAVISFFGDSTAPKP
jgi:hypothetical protein